MRALEPGYSAFSLAAILDALPIVAYLARPDGTISYVSRGWLELIGSDPRDVLGDRYPSIIHPEHRERATATWGEALSAGSTYRDELPLRVGDGTYRWYLSQANPMREPDTGQIVGWFGTVTDIDEQKRAAETLRAQVEFSQRLIDSSDDCIKVLDLDARLISLSRNGQKTLRIMDVETVIGTPWVDFWQGADRLAAQHAVDVALGGGTGRFVGFFPVENESRWFDVVVTAILDADGRPDKLLVVSRDISVQRQTTVALQESEQRYRAFSEALPGITWSASPRGELEFVSERWSGSRGRDARAALGTSWLEGIHPADREIVRRQWAESIASGEPYDAQFRVGMADGTYRWHLVRALPLRGPAGSITRWVGVNVDIDEERRADEAREMFVALAENSSDLIAIADADENVVYVNEAGRELLGIGSLEDAKATRLMDYFPAVDRDDVRRDVFGALDRDGRRNGDGTFAHFQTGARIPVEYTLFKMLDRQGMLSGIATVSRDRRRRSRIDAGLRLLARIGAAALDSLDYMATLRNVAQAFVPDFASCCVVDVVAADGCWQRTVVHRDERNEQPLRDLSAPADDHPVMRAIRRGESSLLVDEQVFEAAGGQPDRIDVLATLNVRSLIVVPVIMPSGEVVGALTCVRDDTHRAGDLCADDVTFVEEVGRRAGATIANVRLYERERRIAVELQAASLPTSLPSSAALHLDAEYRPGSDEATIGGDWYDAFLLGDGRIAITVGDVLGHGLRAAVTMTKLRQAMQAAAMVDPNPNVMLAVADKTLRLLDADGYATAVAAMYDPRERTLTFASAGHSGPVVRTSDGAVANYSCPGLMLGLRSGTESNMLTVALPAQSTFVFYTDGLVEATRDMDFGLERLQQAVAQPDITSQPQPARAIVEYVLGTARASDDIAVLVGRTG